MGDELFTDEMADLAMDIIDGREDGVIVHGQSSNEYVKFECKSIENIAFIAQRILAEPTQRLDTVILPYPLFGFEEFLFKHQHDISPPTSACDICGTANPDATYEHRELTYYAHRDCAKKYNTALDKLHEQIKSNHSEFVADVTASHI